MARDRWTSILRFLKPIVAGLALAYVVTGLVDKPAPVHFQPENPYAAVQSAIVESQSKIVVEKNIMKLGSPLSVASDEVVPAANPLAPLETMGEISGDNGTAIMVGSPDTGGNAIPSPVQMTDNATPVVRGNVEVDSKQP